MEPNSGERAARFGEWTAGCYNIAKIVALLGAALWTLFEWNVSIFPRESHEDFLRKAQKRTDLAVKMGTIKFERLDRPAGQSGSEPSLRHDLLMRGGCTFTNQRDFPIALQSKALVLRFATGIEELVVPDMDETAGFAPFQINWSRDYRIDRATAFGPVNESEGASILEKRGVNLVPFYAPVSVHWKPLEKQRLMELDLEFYVYGVDPETSEEIEGSRQIKRIAHRMLLKRTGLSQGLGRTSRRR